MLNSTLRFKEKSLLRFYLQRYGQRLTGTDSVTREFEWLGWEFRGHLARRLPSRPPATPGVKPRCSVVRTRFLVTSPSGSANSSIKQLLVNIEFYFPQQTCRYQTCRYQTFRYEISDMILIIMRTKQNKILQIDRHSGS